MNGFTDIFKSERAVMALVFLLGLLALLLAGASDARVAIFYKAGGGIVALYTVGKTIRPGARAAAPGPAAAPATTIEADEPPETP